jgi:hypothetical protein
VCGVEGLAESTEWKTGDADEAEILGNAGRASKGASEMLVVSSDFLGIGGSLRGSSSMHNQWNMVLD